MSEFPLDGITCLLVSAFGVSQIWRELSKFRVVLGIAFDRFTDLDARMFESGVDHERTFLGYVTFVLSLLDGSRHIPVSTPAFFARFGYKNVNIREAHARLDTALFRRKELHQCITCKKLLPNDHGPRQRPRDVRYDMSDIMKILCHKELKHTLVAAQVADMVLQAATERFEELAMESLLHPSRESDKEEIKTKPETFGKYVKSGDGAPSGHAYLPEAVDVMARWMGQPPKQLTPRFCDAVAKILEVPPVWKMPATPLPRSTSTPI